MTLIVIDGTDGSGKATLTGMLIERLENDGHETFTLSFPTYGDGSAKPVEAYLRGEFGDLGPYLASHLFAFNRHKKRSLIVDAQRDGKVAVLNRYVSSNIGHQTGKISDSRERKRFVNWLMQLEHGIYGLPQPDCTVILHLPPFVGQQFLARKGEREYLKGKPRDIHEDDLEHLKNAEAAYLEAAEEFGWHVVTCCQDGLSDEQIADARIPPEEKARPLQDILEETYDIVKPLLE